MPSVSVIALTVTLLTQMREIPSYNSPKFVIGFGIYMVKVPTLYCLIMFTLVMDLNPTFQYGLGKLIHTN